MGYNTTLIILNDALDQIENDAEFGRKVSAAIARMHREKGIVISSGNHCNAATVVATHHANYTHVIATGGNHASVLGTSVGRDDHHTPEGQFAILKDLAEQMGYTLQKKP
ncbi:hypothetical protein [Neptuniibacter sp. QD37_11]|uniref:hypothetical protein n=1 Tax=Neptuniibacter sp. QD37_11 TaxID=3398209 RepID=UPI0039F50507